MIDTVLLIEDDPATQMLNKIYIQRALFAKNIYQAYNGNEALQIYEKIQNGELPIESLPQVVLLDLNMPIMDGWEFLSVFLSIYPSFAEKTKIFILSSSVNPEDMSKALTFKNITMYLTKPFDEKQIEIASKMVRN